MKLEEMIYNADIYIKKFNSWNVKEINIDDRRSFFEIRKPGSTIEKVCLFSDEYHMIIYGDYGSYVFDKMTWQGKPYNLQYNNLPYQNEKMSEGTKKAVYLFDDEAVMEDIIDWLKETAVDLYDYEASKINLLVKKICFSNQYFSICDFCYENDCDDLMDLLYFCYDLYQNSNDEIEFISNLRTLSIPYNYEGRIYRLWNAGKRTSQSYLISLLALKICGEKLSNQKDKKMRNKDVIDALAFLFDEAAKEYAVDEEDGKLICYDCTNHSKYLNPAIEIEEYIKQLEEENKTLKRTLNV
ncbi:MAG: hypothetical protein V8R64_16420 [Thomasclavelia sp.]